MSEPSLGNPALVRPRAVLFDLFHTLVQVQPSPDTNAHTWFDLGVTREQWETTLFEDRPGRAIGRVADPVLGMRMLAHQIDPSIAPDRIERAAVRRMERFDRTLRGPEPAIVDALSRLRGAGIRIALVSNAGFDEIRAWSESPLAPHFDATVFSCAVGIAKPDRGIYDEALRLVGVSAEDALFVGDGGSDEHRGARAVGLRPVLVTRLAQFSPTRLAERRPHVDHEYGDVVAFADALLAG